MADFRDRHSTDHHEDDPLNRAMDAKVDREPKYVSMCVKDEYPSRPGKNMIVFDADGTLIGGESIDWASFGGAFEEVAGFTLDDAFFASIEEVTAQAMVHQALAAFPAEQRVINERAVCQAYLRRLKAACENDPSSFPAMDGASALIRELKERGIPIAIATGDWRETISFKLRAAGIPFDDIPMVTSSEFYSRADIIAAAVRKAGRSLEEAVYVGDGLWDLRACKKLGIPFVGVGHRRERLRAAGAVHTLLDLNPLEFWQAKEAAIKPNGFHRAQSAGLDLLDDAAGGSEVRS